MKLTQLIPNVSIVIPYEYEEIKNEEYESIINYYLSDKFPGKFPKLVHMGGIPGSGKSTFYRKNVDKYYKDFVFIGFDNVMKKISSYDYDVEKFGSVEAFSRWEIPARVAGYELLRRAVEAKYNIFLDHSGLCPPHLELLKNIKNYGYETEMHFIRCDLKKAFLRAEIREKKTKRHTPKKLIEDRYELSKTYINEYEKVVDKLFIYN